ncbi:hypothetical protein Afil01_48090 [Actinorhabdospora filicis]|uniref:Uncharacterized protein n=1 Tax=Actinorhabdospora filicis TaxID=1785913 RepID=A0A9W6W554_9ACTN|nr:hypothetical protein Afil01_48090 [Actinorhabdospora filicis]
MPAVGAQAVPAQNALADRAQPLDGPLGALVADVGVPGDPPRPEGAEGVVEEQQFRLGVDAGALPFRADPGAADVQAAVRAFDVVEGRGAGDLTGDGVDLGPRDAGALRVGGVDDGAHVVHAPGLPVAQPGPDAGVGGGGEESFGVAGGQGLQAHVGAGQDGTVEPVAHLVILAEGGRPGQAAERSAPARRRSSPISGRIPATCSAPSCARSACAA